MMSFSASGLQATKYDTLSDALCIGEVQICNMTVSCTATS
jgi:hypothetical protein